MSVSHTQKSLLMGKDALENQTLAGINQHYPRVSHSEAILAFMPEKCLY